MSTELKFDAGFAATKEGDTSTLVYNDHGMFVENAPISKTDIKAFSNYQGDYSKGFLSASIEAAKSEFEKDGNVKNVVTSTSFGVNKTDTLSIHIARDVERTIPSFNGGVPSKVTTVSIQAKIKQHSHLGKSILKTEKDNLHKHLYGDK